MGSPGPSSVRLIPSCSKSAAPSKPAPSNSQRTPRPGRSHHWVSRALSTNQPSPFGTRPRSVDTSSASGTIPLGPDQLGETRVGADRLEVGILACALGVMRLLLERLAQVAEGLVRLAEQRLRAGDVVEHSGLVLVLRERLRQELLRLLVLSAVEHR